MATGGRFFEDMQSAESAENASARRHVEDDAGPSDPFVEFGRHLAHDLNNYATVIRSYSELLHDALPDGTDRDDVAEIQRANMSMMAYVQRVTQFLRTPSSPVVPQYVGPLIGAAISEFAEARDAAPVVAGAVDDARVRIDGNGFVGALIELLRNAREAAPADTTIEVRAGYVNRNGTDGTQVEVRDRGAGFAHQLGDHPEQAFVTTKQGIRGAGFGLTIAQAFARGSDGRLVRFRDGDTTVVGLWLPVHQ